MLKRLAMSLSCMIVIVQDFAIEDRGQAYRLGANAV
jgi:hypothetical protein